MAAASLNTLLELLSSNQLSAVTQSAVDHVVLIADDWHRESISSDRTGGEWFRYTHIISVVHSMLLPPTAVSRTLS